MIATKLQAAVELLRRYAQLWRSAWSMRAQLDRPARDADYLAFLPSELELMETPVHPAPRWTLRALLALSALAVVIALFGRLDIVVTASGTLIPDARVKIVQPALSGVVREIRVRDGDRVAAGALLMKLDTTQASADAHKAHMQRLDAELAAARARALLAAQGAGTPLLLQGMEGVEPDRLQEAQRFAEGTWLDFRNQLDMAQAELRRREAELASTRATIAKLAQTAPLARQQAESFHALVEQRYVARNEYLDHERDAIDKEHELSVQRSHAAELVAAIAGQRAQVEATVSKFRRDQLGELERATQAATQSRDDEAKARTRESLLSLTAPVAGTVQQLAAHTLGGVVTAAQALMEIVPDDALEVQARLPNKDIGFVQIGQRAAIKVEAFPYTRYGYLDGTVIDVSNDAVQDRKLGATFLLRIRLHANRIRVADRWIGLTPGMAVTADIATGRRSVIGYFFDPLMKTARESMRER
jgi:hemolysin D